jgi:hypothetical protein
MLIEREVGGYVCSPPAACSEFIPQNKWFSKCASTGMRKSWHLHCANVSLCCITVSHVSRMVAVHLNICSKLVQNTTFSEYFSGSAWFPTLFRPKLMVHSTARTHLWHTVPWQ